MAGKRGKFDLSGEVGRHYGKVDLDRVGFFDDAPSAPFDKYLSAAARGARSDFKGRQLLAGQANDFFDKTFKRIFDGEALHAPSRKSAGAGGRVMLPPSPAKLHSTPNDWFGCIGKRPDYFSPEVRSSNEAKRKIKGDSRGEPPNFKIKPNPLGGPGYVDICLNPYPKHLTEPYESQDKKSGKGKLTRQPAKFLTASAPLDYFPPNPYVDPKPGPTYVRPENGKFGSHPGDAVAPFYVPFPKQPGGLHAGCFGKFPEHSDDPYQDKRTKEKGRTVTESKFLASGPSFRTKYTNSIINQVTAVSCNANNYRNYREQVYPLPR